MKTKNFLKVLGVLIAVALLLAVLPQQAKAQEEVNATITVCESGCDHTTIQAAVNAASNGDTVYIKAGTYTENVTLTSSTKQLNFIGEVDSEGKPLPEIVGKLAINLTNYNNANWRVENIKFKDNGDDTLYLTNIDTLNVKNCVFDGNNLFLTGHRGIQVDGSGNSMTVENSTFQNGWYVSLQGKFNTLNVTGSIFENVKSGINVQGVSGNSVTITNTIINVIAVNSSKDTYGVRFSGGGTNDSKDLTITGSTINVNKNGLIPDETPEKIYFSAIIVRKGANGSLIANGNRILGEVVNQSSVALDASPNWWGSVRGPATETIFGDVDYTPWCGDAECTFVVYPYTALGDGTLQSAIDNAPDGAAIYVPGPATYSQTGGFNIANDRVRIILGNGVVIRNSSPCFNVNADHVRITAETIGGAKCVPTEGYPGIYADGAINDFVLDGLEIDGTGQRTGAGVNLNAGGSDIQILNNFMHNLSADGIPSTAIDYYAPISGVFDIQGNLFLGTAGIVDMANYGTNAEYNSWGAYTVTKEIANYACSPYNQFPYCDGSESIIDFDPWTHVALFLDSEGTPWEDQVVVGQEITYKVIAQMKNIAGADFALVYDPAKLELVNVTPATGIFQPATERGLIDSSTAGVIRYEGYNYPAVSSETEAGTVLYTVTFKALQAGTTKLAFDASSDQFAMIPPSGPSTNVYVASMETVTVNELTTPSISSTFADDYYLVNEPKTFTVTVSGVDTGFEQPQLKLTLPEGLTLTYNNLPYTGAGIDLVDDENTFTFEATFSTFGQKDLVVNVVDALNGGDVSLATATYTASVYTPPTIAVTNTQSYYLVGVPQTFDLTINNPTTGKNYNNTVQFDLIIEGHTVDDISAAICNFGGHEYDIKAMMQNISGGGVHARIVGVDEYFTVPNSGAALNVPCSITIASKGSYVSHIQMLDIIDLDPLYEREVAKTDYTATVYTKPTINSTNITGPYQQGVPQDFIVNVNNVDSMYDPNSFTLHFNFPEGTTLVYSDVPYTCGSTGCNVPVTLSVPDNALTFTVTFNTAWNEPATITLIDGQVSPNRTLATFTSGNVVVYGNISSVTGTVSMQGRTYRGGVQFTLTGGFGFGPYTATSVDALSNNVAFANLASGTYTITVSQERYLDVIDGLGAKINLGLTQTIAALELKAGDADDDNNIDVDDASIVGGQYKQPSPTNGDINFDGIVNIQDLAMVGSNYGATSATAYAGWMGIPVPNP